MEPVVGYSRAVVAGAHVFVSGTAPIPPDGGAPPDDSYEQARLCLDIIANVLTQAGAQLEHVVRTRIFVTPEADWDAVARAHGEAFAEIRPASAGIVVHSLLDPRWLVEIEADALIA